MSITFEKESSSVTLPSPVPGTDASRVKHQALGLTAGGVRFAYDKGVTRFEVELALESLSDAEKEDLDAFFDSTAGGVTEEFTYTDSAGNEYTARMLSGTLVFTKRSQGVWDAKLKLELDSMAE